MFPPNISQTVFDVACEACDTLCRSCTYDYEVPSCSEQLDHTMSAGGNTTLATLKIDRGYWRSSPNSTTVLGCYNEDACIGGISGEDGFCDDGYEGPCEMGKFGGNMVIPPLIRRLPSHDNGLSFKLPFVHDVSAAHPLYALRLFSLQ